MRCCCWILLVGCAQPPLLGGDFVPEPAPEPEIVDAPPPDVPPLVIGDNPKRDEALPFAIAMTTNAARRRLIDDFNSHTFRDTGATDFRRVEPSYSSKHPTQGSHALDVFVPMSSDPTDLYRNTGAFRTQLPEPEDWRAHAYATLDVYSEVQPTTLPEANLILKNSRGDEFWTSLILGWRLFQWDNHQMTFPLDGNDYNHPPVPPHILSDIVSVELRFGRQGDGQFGPPLPGVRYHIDNFRLSAEALWDSFDGPALGWHASGDAGTGAGVGHNATYKKSAGALALRWRHQGTGNIAGASTDVLAEPLDLSGMHTLQARVRSPAATPVRVRLWDGQHSYASPIVQLAGNDGWQLISWRLPGSGFDLAHVTQVTFEVTQLQYRATGVIYFDDLEAVGDDSGIDAFGVQAGALENYLSWHTTRSASVRASLDTFPSSQDEGVEVCAGARTSCVHAGLAAGAAYYYSVFVDGEAAVAATGSASQEWIVIGQLAYEVGFNPQNGSLGYVRDNTSGKVVSYGGGSLWKLAFLDESVLVSLDSATFSPTSDSRHFSSSDGQLRYDFNEDGRALSLYVDVTSRDDGLSLRAHIDNHTGLAIRTVNLPGDVTFLSQHVQRLLVPMQEGLVLLRNFFTSGKSTYLTRPPLFADVLALESEDGNLAVYAVQDSHYHEELITGHNPNEPVFQPNNLYTRGGPELSTLGIEQVTMIPDNSQWSSVDVRLLVGKGFRDVAAIYRHENGFDDTTRYPTLEQKLMPYGLFDRLAKNPIYTIEMMKLVEWLKAPVGAAWDTLRTDWLPVLPHGTIYHVTHWQYGRDFYPDPGQNHLVEDDHPDTQPIWWSRYGPSGALDQFIDALHADGSAIFPFTNWSVWNKVDGVTHELAPLANTPEAARTLRGADYPFIEYNGYMPKPWHPGTSSVDQAMIDMYRTVYPMDMLFVDMTGERTWRYMLADDGQTATAAYTQGVVEENRRIAARIPLFTEGVFDRIADSITGYSQTLRQKRWNGVLDHIGREYVDWVPYPFAADVVHTNVAFYPHDLNSEIWPATSTTMFTYHLLMGYGLYVDTVKHFHEDHFWIEVADAFAKAVCARTFAQPLADYRLLNDAQTHVQTAWGTTNPLSISAYYDPDGTGAVQTVGTHGIAPNGFYAESQDGDVIAGTFANTFNDHALPPGVHWITVVRDGNRIEVRQPLGGDTTLYVPKPSDWAGTSNVQLSVVLQDGSEMPRGSLSAAGQNIALPYANVDAGSSQNTRAYRLTRP